MAAESIKLLSSMAAREVLADLVALYQTAHPGVAVSVESAGGVEVAKRVKAGEAVDIVVLAANVIDQLIGEGQLLQGSRVDLVRSGVAVAVPAGAALPDISTEAALRQTVLSAPSLSYSTGPSGVYLLKLFERWGVLETIQPRIVQAPPGVPVGSLVAKGEVALGFQQLSELINLPGITVVGQLPAEIQLMTTFSAGVSAASERGDRAANLVAFMAAPAADAAKRKQGMEPA